ncbi:MAG TPA: NAD(P)H-binding protein [Actinocatenispora sp.]
MRLTVIGATGGVGTEVVRQGLAAGHEVVAVVRDLGRLAVPDRDGLTVLVADALDPDALAPAVKGADAAVCALGTRTSGPTTVCTDGVRAMLAAGAAAGVTRFVAISASGAYVDAGDGFASRYLAKPILRRLLRHGFADTRRADDLLRASGTDWTLVRPPKLTDKPGRGTYRRRLDRNVGIRIARADVAHAILGALDDPATVGHVLGVGY